MGRKLIWAIINNFCSKKASKIFALTDNIVPQYPRVVCVQGVALIFIVGNPIFEKRPLAQNKANLCKSLNHIKIFDRNGEETGAVLRLKPIHPPQPALHSIAADGQATADAVGHSLWRRTRTGEAFARDGYSPPSLRAVGSTSRKPGRRPYGPEARRYLSQGLPAFIRMGVPVSF